MTRLKTGDKLDALNKKLQQLAAQKRDLEARQKADERKADTRRKVIAGALALEHMEKNKDSAFASIMGKLLDEYVTRESDRALFPTLPARATK